MQMQRNEAMGEAKHNETRPWERPNIWLRNGTHLELYSLEHESHYQKETQARERP